MRGILIICLGVALFLLSGCEEKQKTAEDIRKGDAGEIKITAGAVEEKSVESKNPDKGEFYYSYNKKEEKAEEEDENYTPIDAYRRVRSPYEEVQISLLAKKLSKDFIIHCSACHDDYANGIIGPSLLDKNATFIYGRLMAYKNGSKNNVLMKDLVSRMSDERLKSLADEIAKFNEKVRKIKAGEKVD